MGFLIAAMVDRCTCMQKESGDVVTGALRAASYQVWLCLHSALPSYQQTWTALCLITSSFVMPLLGTRHSCLLCSVLQCLQSCPEAHPCASDDEQLLGAPSGHQMLVLVEERPDGCLEALMHLIHLLLAGAVHLLYCTAGTLLSACGRPEQLLILDAIQSRQQIPADSCPSLVGGIPKVCLCLAHASKWLGTHSQQALSGRK